MLLRPRLATRARARNIHSPSLQVQRKPSPSAQPTSTQTRALTKSSVLAKRVWHVQKYHGPSPPEFDPADRVTAEEIAARRKFEGRLIAPTASSIPSRAFMRQTTPEDEREIAMSWDGHLTPESKSREPCTLKAAAKKYLQIDKIISLGGGLPDPDLFPIEHISVFVHKGPPFFSHVEGATFTRVLNHKSRPGVPLRAVRDHDVQPAIRKRQAKKYELADGREYDLAVAMNYAQAGGSPQMLRFVTEHTELVHWPKYQDWACAMTIGSTGALEQTFRMLLSRGDSLLADRYTFSTMLETARPLGVNIVGIRSDDEGIVPSALEERLSSWDESQGRKPKVIYVVPTGHNPTGATMSRERREMIYLVAKTHNLVIIEDDPYHFLQYTPHPALEELKEEIEAAKEGMPAGHVYEIPHRNPEVWVTDDLAPSFLSLDTDGRVIRLDSFSKVFLPGVRMGWVTAPEQVVERFIRHSEVASQGPSGLSQLIAHKIMDPEDGGWGHLGYLEWLMELKNQYQKRRDVLVQACEEHFRQESLAGIVNYEVPKAGMFMWVSLDPKLHPEYPNKSVIEIESEVFEHAVSNGVLMARGSWFLAERPEGLVAATSPAASTLDEPFPTPDPSIDLPTLSFRLTYAAASKEDMRSAIRRLAKAIRAVYNVTDPEHEFMVEMGFEVPKDVDPDAVEVIMAEEEKGEQETWKESGATHRDRSKKKGFMKVKEKKSEGTKKEGQGQEQVNLME